MKRILCLATAALLALLIVAPAAWAQDDMMMDESTMMDQNMMMDDSNMMDQNMMAQPKMMDQPKMMEKGKMEMPKTGGPVTLSVLVPVGAALLLGSSAMAYAVLRRR